MSLFRNEGDKSFFLKIMKISSEEELNALRQQYRSDDEFQKFVDRVIDDEIRRLRFLEYGPVEKYFVEGHWSGSYAAQMYGEYSDRYDEYQDLLGARIDRRHNLAREQLP